MNKHHISKKKFLSYVQTQSQSNKPRNSDRLYALYQDSCDHFKEFLGRAISGDYRSGYVLKQFVDSGKFPNNPAYAIMWEAFGWPKRWVERKIRNKIFKTTHGSRKIPEALKKLHRKGYLTRYSQVRAA